MSSHTERVPGWSLRRVLVTLMIVVATTVAVLLAHAFEAGHPTGGANSQATAVLSPDATAVSALGEGPAGVAVVFGMADSVVADASAGVTDPAGALGACLFGVAGCLLAAVSLRRLLSQSADSHRRLVALLPFPALPSPFGAHQTSPSPISLCIIRV